MSYVAAEEAEWQSFGTCLLQEAATEALSRRRRIEVRCC